MNTTSDLIDGERDALISRVRTLCETFTDGNKPLLLSALGKLLGQDLRRIKSITGGALSDLFKGPLSDKFDLIQIGVHKNIIAVVPKSSTGTDAPSSSRLAALFVDNASAPKPDRFNRRFWAAFSVPPAGEKRILNIDNFLFQDVNIDEKPASKEVEIANDLIPAAEADDRDLKIHQSIKTWLETNHFDKHRFLQNKEDDIKEKLLGRDRKSLLDFVLETLDHGQLKSVSLSLDVISALAKRKV